MYVSEWANILWDTVLQYDHNSNSEIEHGSKGGLVAIRAL
jgi:hypothetical protein